MLRNILLAVIFALLSLTLALSLAGATVDDAKIHWSSTGKGKKSVILVHGGMCDESFWSRQVPALAQKYRVITLDLPGHGQSGSPADGKFSMDLFARAVEAVRREAKVQKAVLVGHSMGTPVVRQYARLYPKHAAALVLVDGVVVVKAENFPAFQALAKQIAGPNGKKAREDFIRSRFTPATTPDLQEAILKVTMAAPEATAVGDILSLADLSVWKDNVSTLPVLGIYAEKSQPANQEYLKIVFPNLEYVEIPGSDHFLMMEKPEEFNRLLLAFLDKVYR